MKISICHYSFRRSWKNENWTIGRLCDEVKALGVEGLDFHVRFLPDVDNLVDEIKTSLKSSGLELSGFSLSTDFNLEDKSKYEEMIEDTISWMRLASELEAPVSRVFGGRLKRYGVDKETKETAFSRVVDALGRLSIEAEKLGVVLALENHGGLPCTGEEQVEMLDAVGSKYVQATIDVGNYMTCGQEAVEGTKTAANYCSYVHFKDFKKEPDTSRPWGWGIKPTIVGRGDVDHLGCLREIKAAGFDGYIAIEYEALEEDNIGVPESVEFTKKVLEQL